MKKILIVIPSIHKWGWAEKIATQVGNALSRDYEVVFFTFHKKQQEYNILWENMCLDQWEKSSLQKICLIPINAYKIYRYCKKNKVDVMISHMERANFISILASILLKNVKQISVVHSHKYSLQFINALLIRFLYPYAENIVCVSKGIEDLFKTRFVLHNTKTIYNALEKWSSKKWVREDILRQDEQYFKTDVFRYITVWKLRDAKAQERIIESYSHVYEKNMRTQLIIIWEGDYRQKLEQKIQDLGLEENVFLIWSRDNIFPYLEISDCFVFSSKWEWFGIVLAEALSLGLPTISTDCHAGPREILAPELDIHERIEYPYIWKHGVLESNDDFSPKSFAQSMMDIQNKRYSFQRDVSKRFDLNNIISQWKKIIW